MFHRLRWFLLGPPLPTQQEHLERLSNPKALAVFSPDALSSIAYANQEIYLGLIVAGSAALALSFPISLAIVGLLIILSLSYFQTIQGYPTGGGSYIVARENLGTGFGLVAAAALLLDYLLTAAVSLSAAVAAISSAFPVLWNYRVLLALLFLILITLINLRGVRETGNLISVPVYGFILSYFALLAFGFFQIIRGDLVAVERSIIPAAQPLSLFLILHTFSTGCTALTGIEAISNGIPAFRPPEARNAGKTLIVMAVIMGGLFLGSIGLTQFLGVTAVPQETILSALARQVFGNGILHLIIQITTMGILVVAANTSFAGFPRVASILAKDRFLPRQFLALGDRLVFSNGILFLALACGFLIIIFNADSHRLVPLFAVGAFLAFLLSQTGMVFHWKRTREPGWQVKLFLNLIGAVLTGITLLVVGITKFLDGAWISILLIALLFFVFGKIRTHYEEVARQLSLQKQRPLPANANPNETLRIIIPVSGVHNGVVEAVRNAQSITSNICAVYVELEPGAGEKLAQKWQEWFPNITLEMVPSPYRSIVGPFLDYLDEKDREQHDGQLAAVLIPEFIPAKWWQSFLHNQTAWSIKLALLYRRRRLGFQRMIIDVPIHLQQ
ncbi:MAG: APC family permease [Ardenticatenaceae bacterium]|nr:APC family permease [Ardenticatenaceae bacterium]